MSLISQKTEEFWVLAVALLGACVLAAHVESYYVSLGEVGSYLYWFGRVIIEAAFYMTSQFAIEKYLKQLIPPWACYILAVMVSLIPFTLTITALDLIIGLPVSRELVFGVALFSHFDNHLTFCALLLVPRLLLEVNDNASYLAVSASSLAFLDSIKPPLSGHICSMEAQEHYILVTTTTESRMILHRFSDAVKQTSSALGMQVHRSHWVAHSAVQEVVIEGQNMRLKLAEDKIVPVSRTFRAAAESRYLLNSD